MARPTQAASARGSVAGTTLVICRGLLLLAMLIDGYLAMTSSAGGTVAGCGVDSGCHAVLKSRWAYWFGLPVSGPGLLVYAAILVSTFWLDGKTPAPLQRRAWTVAFPGALAVFGAAAWFICLQIFVIGRFCPYCMTAHVSASLGCALLLLGIPVGESPTKTKEIDRNVFVPAAVLAKLTLAALGGLGVLVLGQFVNQPQTFVSDPIVAGIATNQTVSPTTAARSTNTPVPVLPPAPVARVFQLFNGKIEFKLSEVPLIGQPEAPNVMVSLFDYTCHHCREMHEPIMEAFHRFSNELAIVSLPMPLDAKCNTIMKQTPPDHVNACALARIGLTVWNADRNASPKFDEWMFSTNKPPQPEVAEAFARQLVGPEKYERSATNDWVDRQLQQDIAIFAASYQQFHRGNMPQLIIGTNLISGTFRKDHLYKMLGDQFGLKAAAN